MMFEQQKLAIKEFIIEQRAKGRTYYEMTGEMNKKFPTSGKPWSPSSISNFAIANGLRLKRRGDQSSYSNDPKSTKASTRNAAEESIRLCRMVIESQETNESKLRMIRSIVGGINV